MDIVSSALHEGFNPVDLPGSRVVLIQKETCNANGSQSKTGSGKSQIERVPSEQGGRMSVPPIHPAIVHLPIAFVLLSVTADFFARLSKAEQHRAAFRTLGFWSLVAALTGGLITIAAGYWDMNHAALTRETDSLVDLHMTIGWILAASLAWLTAWRWLIWHRGQMTINTAYLVAGFLVLGLTFFQGWYGGEMVYSYGAGVAAAGQGTESAGAAQRRLATVQSVLEPNAAVGGAESPGGTNQQQEVHGNDKR